MDKLDLMQKRTADADELTKDILVLEIGMSDNQVKEYAKNFYENKYKDKKFTLDEQIVLLSSLGQFREMFAWIIGDIFLKIEKKIEKCEIIEYKSLNDFFDNYQGEIGISKATMYNCKNVRSRFSDFNVFLKVGIKKAVILMQIQDEKTFDKIIDDSIKKDLSAPQVFEMVTTAQNKVKEKENKIRREHKEEIKERGFYDIIFGKNKNEIIIKCKSGIDRDTVIDALNKYEIQIKMFIDRE